MKKVCLDFGFSVVNAGQRQSGNLEPQLIAVSTTGGFRITGPATRLLGVAAGENIMFVNNVDVVEQAINDTTHPMHSTIVAFCEQNGLELGTPAANKAIHAEFDTWVIAKAIQEFDTKGNPKVAKERLTKRDKITYVTNNFEESLAKVMNSEDEGADEVKERLEGATREEQIEILAELIQGREVDSYKGSKTANAAGQTGTGLTLNFTDNNVWNQLKADIDVADRQKVNRVFDLLVDNIINITISNGYEDVTIPAIPLGEYSDVAPSRIGGEEA